MSGSSLLSLWEDSGGGVRPVNSSNVIGQAGAFLAAQAVGNKSISIGSGTPGVAATSSVTSVGINAGAAVIAGGTENTFIGADAGKSNTDGQFNAFLGKSAGEFNITGDSNTYFGRLTGRNGTAGSSNTFIGNSAGAANTATGNTFVGSSAGILNTSGSANVFVGNACGVTNLIGAACTFVGNNSGNVSLASSNTFLGANAGLITTSANNTFVGAQAGVVNASGAQNTYIGVSADGTAALTNSMALGFNAKATVNNEIVFGDAVTPVNKWKVAAVDWTMPAAQGGAATVLTNDGAGILSWAAGGGGGALAYVEHTVVGPTTVAVNSSNTANNVALVTLTLPAAAAIGDIIEIGGKGAGGWLLAQVAGQTVHFGTTDSTTGIGGSLASTAQYDVVRLVCTTANTDFRVNSSVGTITIV